MIFSKFWMFKDLEELQINDCQTDICLVGAGGVKVFIHRTMLTSTLKRMTLGSLLLAILSTDRVLEYLRTWPGAPDNVREAVVDYLKATWKVYLVSMKKEVDGDYEQVFRTFREKFELVRKLLRVSHTVKIHCVLDNMICHAPFQSLSWTTELYQVISDASSFL